MLYNSPLLAGTFIKRYKRFFADIELDSGQVITAHCPNTGAMSGCAEPGFRAYVSQSDNPKRKLKYTWELAQNHLGHFIGINTHRANKIVAEALTQKSLPLFNQVHSFKAEVTPPGADSRFDFQLDIGDGEKSYMEVKSVTLLEDGQGYFPDAVTTRGKKHCETLIALQQRGVRTQLLFCVQHTGISSVRPAAHIDPEYADAVQRAKQAGVTIMAASCLINEQKTVLNQELPVFL